MTKAVEWVKSRVSEPSTWAAVGASVVGLNKYFYFGFNRRCFRCSWFCFKGKRSFVMPQGKGTYGTKRGRPPKKKGKKRSKKRSSKK